MRKIIALGVMLLFLGMTISSSGYNLEKQLSVITIDGNTLYVGGSGPNNYTKIQDAIDNASDGDTVFVYSGTYYEEVIVKKSIILVGEDRNTTIIEANAWGIIVMNTNNVIVQGFTTTNGYGMNVQFENCSNCTFYNNNVYPTYCDKGLTIYYSNEINISKNYFTATRRTIEVGDSRNCIIKNNCIVDDGEFDWPPVGIRVSDSNNITILHNHISKCFTGICIDYSESVSVIQNNIVGNVIRARFALPFVLWEGNYWGRPRFLPFPILGCFYILRYTPLFLPIIDFDWHPAREPYDIGV